MHGNRRQDHSTARVILHPVLQHQALVVPYLMDQAAMQLSLSLREWWQDAGGFRVYRVFDWRLGEILQCDAQARAVDYSWPSYPAAEP